MSRGSSDRSGCRTSPAITPGTTSSNAARHHNVDKKRRISRRIIPLPSVATQTPARPKKRNQLQPKNPVRRANHFNGIPARQRTQGPTKTKGHGKIIYPAAPALGRATCRPYLPRLDAYNQRCPPPVLPPTVAGFGASPRYNSSRSHTHKAKSHLFGLRRTPGGTKPSSGSPMARLSQRQITSPSTQCLPSRSSISITQRSGSRSVWRAM